MKRRSKAGGKPVGKTVRSRRGAPKAERGRNPSIADLQEQLDRRTRERDEALARQAATADILRIISQSPAEVRPVFDRIVFTAVRLLHCDLAVLFLCDGNTITHAAAASPEGPYADLPMPFSLDPGVNFPSRAIVDKKMLHLPDWSLIDPPEHELKMQKMWGVKSSLYLPLLREGDCIGVLGLAGPRPNTFGAAEIAQAEAFRDQAVIAIENARLLNDLRHRTTDLTEALEQQTATADVLKVISRSTFDLQTVLNTLLTSAARLCRANHSFIFLREGDAYRLAAGSGDIPEWIEYLKQQPIRPGRGTVAARAVLEGRAVHITDVLADPEYTFLEAQKRGGFRTALGIPLLREAVSIGAMVLTRPTVRPFDANHIALVTTFADQAVIAIENVRLFEAEQQRTRELTESLEQQTATAEVLRVISSSPGDLQPVFASMLENAVRICDAQFGNIYRWDGDALHLAAAHNIPPAFAEFRGRTPLRPNPKLAMGRMVATKAAVHVVDNAAEQAYIEREPSIVATVELGGVRTYVAVPMLKGSELIGAVTVYRQEVRPFTDKQMELVQNFAAQAVIAIENTRLLTELRRRTDDLTESLEQQTATSEVLQVISSSPGDLQPVFKTMLDNAVRICEAKFGNIYRWDGDALHLVASHNTPAAFAEQRRRESFRPSPKNSVGQMIATKKVVHIPDVVASEAYIEREPVTVAGVEIAGIRTFLAVPMLKENELVGAFALARQEVRPFTEKQVELVTSFAAQAVIAIENARLLTQLRQRTDELAQRQAELSVTFDNMGDGVVMFNEEMRLAAWNRNLQEILDLPEFILCRAPDLSRLHDLSHRARRVRECRSRSRIATLYREHGS